MMSNRKMMITPEMKHLMDRTTPLTAKNGGQRLRDLYKNESLNFNPMEELSHFAGACYFGALEEVEKLINSGNALPLTGTETAFKSGYATITILGAQRVSVLPGDSPTKLKHAQVLRFLLAKGTPPNVPDILGYTALHHVCMSPYEKTELARILLENGANVDYQDRFASSAIFAAMQHKLLDTIDVLMEFGADTDLPEIDNFTPLSAMSSGGPEVVARITAWLRKRTGEQALRDGKKCGCCDKSGVDLMLCNRCKIQRYCSKECQRSDWPRHKPICKAFDDSNTVILKPYYDSRMSNLISISDFTRNYQFGAHGAPKNSRHTSTGKGTTYPSMSPGSTKSIIIKAQVPIGSYENLQAEPTGHDILVYTKKREFTCLIRRQDNPQGYDQLFKAVREKGVQPQRLKAYFAAELKGKDELAVKVGEVLAEQPF